MLACGTGIAPMIQVIRLIVENENDDTQVFLLYSTKTQGDILFKDILDKFKDYWNFTVKYALSRSSIEFLEANKCSIKYGDQVRFGRINEEMIVEEIMPVVDSNSYILVCGTKSFSKDMIKILTHLGKEKNQIFLF